MTTIAFKAGVMASDSCVSCQEVFITSQTKVFRTKAGALIGQAGDADCRAIMKLLDNVKNGGQLPEKDVIERTRTEFELLIAFSPKNVWYVGAQPNEAGVYGAYVYQAQFPFAATGSGWKFALAAMKCGKSATEAVRVACEFDRYSRLPVHQMSLDQKRPKSKPKPK